MTYSEKIAFVSDLTRGQFAAVTNVTAIVPIEQALLHNSATPTNFLAPVANHIYYIENITICEVTAITGNSSIQAYDIAAVANTIYNAGLIDVVYNSGNFWCTRLANLAGVGFFSIVFNGFDITYT